MKKLIKTSVPVFLLFLILFVPNSNSQDSASWFKEYRTVIPGKHYEAGGLHRFFFGAHWRDIWTTPVSVPVVDLQKYGGGLTPTEKGGGLQTKSLKFKGGNGTEYKFRTLDKDPRKTLSPELQESIAKDIVQDQISSANPYAGFVVNPILDAVGLYHTEYTLVILPDDPALGKFRSEFGNLLGIIEIVPDEKQFKGSDKIIGSNKLFDRLNKEFDESVDGKEFLKARLIDILVGDWDRHKDQWKWIRYEEGNKKLYKPYPTDRDQAFAKLDGLFPYIAESNIPQLNHFGYSYPKMRFLTWNGRYVDQRFLTFVDKKEWDAVTNDVQSKITDNVIENAVKKLPPEAYNKAKDELTIKLKSRRNKLKEASEEYYQLVNSVVDIYTTDKDDLVEISFNPVTGIDLPATDKDKDVTRITIFKRDKNSGQTMGDILRQKMFDNDVTDDIRLYVGDGDDEIKISGKTDKMPVIRIIGGDGKDEIINNSDEKVYFYDDSKKSTMKGGVSWDNDKYKYPYENPLKEFKKKKETLTEEEKDKYEDSIANLRYAPVIPPDKFGMTTFYPIFNYNPDIGIFFGANFGYLKYGFRMKPYNYKLSLTLGYAPEKAGIRGLLADFKGQFLGVAKRMSLNLHLRKSGIEVNNNIIKSNMRNIWEESE
jgi:hypothetical protein